MRKALIAIAVATALFAVGAFAASFTVQSEDIASGADSVDNCADVVDVDFVTVYDDAGDWDVTGVELTFYTGSPGSTTLTENCVGSNANVAIMTTGTTPAETVIGEIDGSSTTLTLPDAPYLKASAVTEAAVLVDGEQLETNNPGEGF